MARQAVYTPRDVTNEQALQLCKVAMVDRGVKIVGLDRYVMADWDCEDNIITFTIVPNGGHTEHEIDMSWHDARKILNKGLVV